MQNFRIKLKSYDHTLVDRSAEEIVKLLKEAGAYISGPIPLPTRKTIITVLRSPHVNKKSREQFEIRFHKRIIEVYNADHEVVERLANLVLPTGVDVEIKMLQ